MGAPTQHGCSRRGSSSTGASSSSSAIPPSTCFHPHPPRIAAQPPLIRSLSSTHFNMAAASSSSSTPVSRKVSRSMFAGKSNSVDYGPTEERQQRINRHEHIYIFYIYISHLFYFSIFRVIRLKQIKPYFELILSVSVKNKLKIFFADLKNVAK